MQQQTNTVIDDNNLQAVTGGVDDKKSAGIAGGTGAGGAIIGAAAGTAAMRHEMKNRIKYKTNVLTAKGVALQNQLKHQNKTLQVAARGMNAVRAV
jgi:hypothetical protein